MVRFTRQMILGVAGLALVLSAVPVQGASPTVAALDQVGADADMVVVIPKLAEAGRKLTSWIEAAGIPMPMAEGGGDALLNDFKANMGIEAGFNDNGSIVILIQNIAATMQQDTTPDVLLLMPVSDYAAFVGNFGGEANGVTSLTMPQGSPGFAKQVGGYALLGENQDMIEAYAPANQGGAIVASLGARGATVLDASDAIFYINIEKVAPQLKTAISDALDGFKEMMTMMGDEANADGAVMAMNMYGTAANAVLDGSNALLIGFDITDAGLGFSEIVTMKPGSTLASYFPGTPAGASTAGAELAQLPDKSYIVAGAVDGKAINIGKLYEAMGDAMGPEMLEIMGEGMLEKAIALSKGMQSASFVFYTPDEMAVMSGSMLNTLTTIKTDDAEAYSALVREYIQSMNGFSLPAGPDGATVSYTTSYTENALQLEGVDVDQFQIQTVMPPEMMQMMGPAAPLMNMFTSYRGYIAAKGDRIVVTTSADPQMVTAALNTAAAGNGLGATGAIAEQRKNILPENAALEFYLNLGGVAETANQFMTMFGMPPMIQVPENLPPISGGFSTDGKTLYGRYYVPTKTVQFVMEAYMQAMMMGGGGGPPPQQGGPAPY